MRGRGLGFAGVWAEAAGCWVGQAGRRRAVSRVPEGSPAAAGGSSRDATPNFLTSTRYLAWLYSPPDQQPAFAALCEIESEVAASLRPGIDHHVAHARLQWWRDESERVGRGQPVHPLTRELVARAAGGSPGASLDISGFVDTGIWDLASATFERHARTHGLLRTVGVSDV